jgi:hypothetical protein
LSGVWRSLRRRGRSRARESLCHTL